MDMNSTARSMATPNHATSVFRVVLVLNDTKLALSERGPELAGFVTALDKHLLLAASLKDMGPQIFITLEGHEEDVGLIAVIVKEAFPNCDIETFSEDFVLRS